MKQETINISGMHCNGCVKSVTNALNKINGVTGVEVSLTDERAVVQYDETKTNIEQLNNAVTEAGYEVVENVW